MTRCELFVGAGWDIHGNIELGKRGQILFENVQVDDIIQVIGCEETRRTEENHGKGISSRTQAEGDPECLDRAMGLQRIFLGDDDDRGMHNSLPGKG